MSEATAITIGNFDGVHAGHLALLQAARRAVEPNGRVVACFFHPHPISIIRPSQVPVQLTAPLQRRRFLRDAGADEAVQIEPTPTFLSQSPEAFLRAIVDQHRPAWIVEGHDFHFGAARAGTVDTLRAFESTLGYRTIVVEPVSAVLTDHTETRVSSSLIRWLLVRGRVRDAATLLSRPFEVEATVIEGRKRGRKIGFPTANLDVGDTMLPRDGVYAGVATLPGGAVFPAAISVGSNPTFGDTPRTCEVHLPGYDGPVDHYGWTLRVQWTAWIRDQIGYGSVGPLVEQIQRDVDRCRAWATEVEMA